MKTSKIGVLTAVFAAALVCPTVSTAWAVPASHVRPNFAVSVTGYGATLTDAERDAKQQIRGDYYGCGTISLYSDEQLADGTWSATMGASDCIGYN
jgi:hypothetical protein